MSDYSTRNTRLRFIDKLRPFHCQSLVSLFGQHACLLPMFKHDSLTPFVNCASAESSAARVFQMRIVGTWPSFAFVNSSQALRKYQSFLLFQGFFMPFVYTFSSRIYGAINSSYSSFPSLNTKAICFCDRTWRFLYPPLLAW